MPGGRLEGTGKPSKSPSLSSGHQLSQTGGSCISYPFRGNRESRPPKSPGLGIRGVAESGYKKLLHNPSLCILVLMVLGSSYMLLFCIAIANGLLIGYSVVG